MEISCYYEYQEIPNHTNDYKKTTFAFAKKNNIIYVEINQFMCLNHNFDEDNCKFFINIDEIDVFPTLKIYYILSLALTENKYIDYYVFGVRCKMIYQKEFMTEKYLYAHCFQEHPIAKFNQIMSKRRGYNGKLNKYNMRHFNTFYNNKKDTIHLIDIYMKNEIKQIDKQLNKIEKKIHKDIILQNICCLHEILPSDIVGIIENKVMDSSNSVNKV